MVKSQNFRTVWSAFKTERFYVDSRNLRINLMLFRPNLWCWSCMYTHFDAKFVTFWILKTKNSSNQIFVVARFGIVKSGHSLFKIQVIFFRESTFVAFDKSAFITSCATQSDELFRKIIAMHGFLTACASWTRQHAETAAFAANRSHSIYILKQLRK